MILFVLNYYSSCIHRFPHANSYFVVFSDFHVLKIRSLPFIIPQFYCHCVKNLWCCLKADTVKSCVEANFKCFLNLKKSRTARAWLKRLSTTELSPNFWCAESSIGSQPFCFCVSGVFCAISWLWYMLSWFVLFHIDVCSVFLFSYST